MKQETIIGSSTSNYKVIKQQLDQVLQIIKSNILIYTHKTHFYCQIIIMKHKNRCASILDLALQINKVNC